MHAQTAASGQPGGVTRLTLSQAEQPAPKNNPQMTGPGSLLWHKGRSRARPVYRASQATCDLTAVEPRAGGTRIAAGGAQCPSASERAAGGVVIGQSIWAFAVVTSSSPAPNFANKRRRPLRGMAADVTLAVDEAFDGVLASQALPMSPSRRLRFGRQPPTRYRRSRKPNSSQTVDLSFATINLVQAQSLLLDAENTGPPHSEI